MALLTYVMASVMAFRDCVGQCSFVLVGQEGLGGTYSECVAGACPKLLLWRVVLVKECSSVMRERTCFGFMSPWFFGLKLSRNVLLAMPE